MESVFLNMEGVASWVAYEVVGDGADPMTFSGRFWSQQEGLLLFLLLDRFDPGWKSRVFAESVPDPFAMLRAAVTGIASIGGTLAPRGLVPTVRAGLRYSSRPHRPTGDAP